MPTIATRTPVLEGRAEVITYARDTSVYYLRQFIKEKKGYRTRKIDGVDNLNAAKDKALEVYIELSQPIIKGAKSSTNRRGIKEGTKVTPSRELIVTWVNRYIEHQQERCDKGIIKEITLKNKKEALRKHLLGYCEAYGLVRTNQIKAGCFDRYQVYRSKDSKSSLTLRKESATIAEWIGYLVTNRLIDPYEAAQKSKISPSIRLNDGDFDSNPPIRDLDEWLTILKEIRIWIEEAHTHPNTRVKLWRQMFWSLMLYLKQTGARPNEARNLCWNDIEFENIGRVSKTQRDADIGELQVQGIDISELPEEIAEGLGRVDRFVTHSRILQSKTGRIREITSNSAQCLIRWRKLQQEWGKHNFNYDIKGSDLVFGIPSMDGVVITPYNTLNINWRKLMKRLDGKLKGPLMSPHPYTIYSLRSTRAQELMDLGVDVYLAATQMGHSVAMLEKVYARLPQRRRATQEAAHIEFGKRKQKNDIVPIEDLANDAY